MYKRQIPFRARDVVPNLYEHWIAQDFLAYIRAALGERDRSTIFRIVNRPKRYVSRDSMDDPVVDFEKVKSFYQDKDLSLIHIYHSGRTVYRRGLKQKRRRHTMEQTILNAAGVEKRYKTFTLKPTDLAVPGGCIVGLIGENGAGKSTLIKSPVSYTHLSSCMSP